MGTNNEYIQSVKLFLYGSYTQWRPGNLIKHFISFSNEWYFFDLLFLGKNHVITAL